MKSYKVQDIMSTELVTIGPEDSVEKAYKLLKRHKIRQVLVCVNNKIVGIITDRDLREIVGHNWHTEKNNPSLQVLNSPIKNYMTTDPITVTPDLNIEEAVQIMNSRKYGSLPVCDKSKSLIGIVTITDISNLLLTLLKNCN